MNVTKKIVRFIKEVFLLPINVSLVVNELKRIENKIDLLNQRLGDLDLNYTSGKEAILPSTQELSESLKFSISTDISKIFENYFLQIEALKSIYKSLPNIKYLPATRGWAGSPDFLNKIVEIILKQKPRFVLEASSGVSSVVIGLALKMNNYGKALSLEHNISYAEITRKNLEVNYIGDISTLINCPINDCLIDGEKWKWYEIEGLTFTDKIDILIIDGPPRTTQKLARYPAIPILYNHFSDNFIILLDDAKRPDEIIIVEKWIEFLEKKGCNIIIERNLNFEKGLVILIVKKKIENPRG
jgi:hypothetical protein